MVTTDEPHAKQLDPAESTLALEREILTTDTKLELVLAAYDELTQFASQVKQVKSLEHVVNGSDFEGKISFVYIDFEETNAQIDTQCSHSCRETGT